MFMTVKKIFLIFILQVHRRFGSLRSHLRIIFISGDLWTTSEGCCFSSSSGDKFLASWRRESKRKQLGAECGFDVGVRKRSRQQLASGSQRETETGQASERGRLQVDLIFDTAAWSSCQGDNTDPAGTFRHHSEILAFCILAHCNLQTFAQCCFSDLHSQYPLWRTAAITLPLCLTRPGPWPLDHLTVETLNV